jgi:hypothetical protein
LFHLFSAAALAISDLRAGLVRAALVLQPRFPNSAAALLTRSVSSSSVSSPVAIRMTLTALPITSAGRFSPRGPLGIWVPRKQTVQLGKLSLSLSDTFRCGIARLFAGPMFSRSHRARLQQRELPLLAVALRSAPSKKVI